MATKTIRVAIVEPGKAPREAYIQSTPEVIRGIIGGYVESFTVTDDLLVLCNGEGWLRTLKPCCNICGVSFAGTIIICGKRQAGYSDLPVSLEELKEMFPSLWEGETERKATPWKPCRNLRKC